MNRGQKAFTLVEVMVSAAGSVLVIGALIVGSLQLHKSLHASEVFASSMLTI